MCAQLPPRVRRGGGVSTAGAAAGGGLGVAGLGGCFFGAVSGDSSSTCTAGGRGGYSAQCNLTLPASLGKRPPTGGLRVRLRAPLHAGKIVAVTVNGAKWTAFSAADETVDFAAAALTPEMVATKPTAIVAHFA